MSDIVERLRGAMESQTKELRFWKNAVIDKALMWETISEITRLREGLRECGEAYGRDVMSMAKERNDALDQCTELHKRIAHLERVQEAADADPDIDTQDWGPK